MPKTNISDEYIRRQFYINGLGNRLGDDFVNELNKSNRNAYAIFLEMLPAIIATRPLTRKRSKMLEKLSEEITAARGEYILRYRLKFEAEMERLVELEFKANKKLFDKIPLYEEPIEEESNLSALLLLLLLHGTYNGLNVGQWFDGFSKADTKRIMQTATLGISNGDTPEDIAKAVFGTKALKYKDGIVSASINSARSLARTVASGIANKARTYWAESARMRKKNDLNLLEVFSAILDSRTTFLCASLSGNVYKVGLGPIPPLHQNCRSSRYPIPYELAYPESLKVNGVDFVNNARRRNGGKAWDEMSSAQHKAEVIAEKKRWLEKNIGVLPENLGFAPWFDKQPLSFQFDYLGATRYNAWKSGAIEIGDFVAPDGARYTIDELISKGVL